MKPIQLSTFTYKDQDFDVLVHKNKISYIFQVGNERYGNAVEVKGRTKRDVVDAAFNLLINFIESYEKTKE